MFILTLALFIHLRIPLEARVIEVGPAKPYTLPGAAAAVAEDGDTVLIDAGSYVDCATWTRNNLLIRGVGGYAHVHDKSCGGKAIWVIQGNNTTVENIEFSGAAVPDRNGAGIRQEGTNLTVRHCFFHDSEEGILAGDNAASTILIEYSEFARCGYGDGYSHNMYINHVRRFTIRNSYIHHARVGHDIKSRAYETYILYNRISDESDGTASRNIDLPNGGFAVILGNLIHHGPKTENSNAIAFGLEGLTNPARSLFIACNTIVNERSPGSFVNIPGTGTDTLKMVDNIFAGPGTLLVGKAAALDTSANLIRAVIAQAGLADPAAYDYHLLPGSPAINAGIDPGFAAAYPLVPQFEYVHPASATLRLAAGIPDIGAYEYIPPAAVAPDTKGGSATIAIESLYPQPASASMTVGFSVPVRADVTLRVIDLLGRLQAAGARLTAVKGKNEINLSTTRLPAGMYFLQAAGNGSTAHRMFLIGR